MKRGTEQKEARMHDIPATRRKKMRGYMFLFRRAYLQREVEDHQEGSDLAAAGGGCLWAGRMQRRRMRMRMRMRNQQVELVPLLVHILLLLKLL
jgi:hypothetical protein